MILKKLALLLIIFFLSFSIFLQNHFRILNADKESIRFKFINNLIIIPVEVNGQKLNFLLDTGVKQSLLFNVVSLDSVKLNQLKNITIRGLGENESFKALKSENNLLRINKIFCPDFEVLVILDENFDFSNRIGLDIHGILGSELFKDFIIEVNYAKKKITFNNPKKYKYRKCNKCNSFPLTFHFNKPYIKGIINTIDNQQFPVKLLIDSGGGDSLWLFEKSFSTYKIPSKNIDDMLGRGLNGNIYGKKSKLKSLSLGTFNFKDLIISHPDSTSAIGNNIFFKRNGLLGAELLKRFHIIYDYPHSKITLKKNKKYYYSPFSYNKTGIELIHYGQVLVKEAKSHIFIDSNDAGSSNNNQIIISYSYAFKNAYQISYIKPDSIADKAGLKEHDIITKINGINAYEFTLSQIMHRFSDVSGKTVKIQVNRNQLFYDYKIKLKDLL